MTRSVWLLFAVALSAVLVGGGLIVLQVVDYVNRPLKVDSTAGLPVFMVDDELVSYPWFEPGLGFSVVNAGMLLLAGAAFVGAATWRARQPVDRRRR